MNDKEMIVALQSRDEKAFAELVIQFQPMVNRLIYKITADADDTLDLSQEVFIAIWQQIKLFRGESALSTWIYKLSMNKALNHLKQKKRRAIFSLSVMRANESAPKCLHPSQNDAATQLDRADDNNAIALALKQLPDNQRAAFVLSKSEGLSNPQIAEILGLTVPAVESLNFRARQSLTKILQHYYEQKKS